MVCVQASLGERALLAFQDLPSTLRWIEGRDPPEVRWERPLPTPVGSSSVCDVLTLPFVDSLTEATFYLPFSGSPCLAIGQTTNNNATCPLWGVWPGLACPPAPGGPSLVLPEGPGPAPCVPLSVGTRSSGHISSEQGPHIPVWLACPHPSGKCCLLSACTCPGSW